MKSQGNTPLGDDRREAVTREKDDQDRFNQASKQLGREVQG